MTRTDFRDPSGRRLVVSLDLDHTLIPWVEGADAGTYCDVTLGRSLEFFGRPEVKERVFLLLNTGRGVPAFHRVRPIVERFPVDGVCLNNGRQLFLRPEGAPVAGWLAAVDAAALSASWREELGRGHGWDEEGAFGLFLDAVRAAGMSPADEPDDNVINFTTSSGRVRLTAEVPDRETVFVISGGEDVDLTAARGFAESFASCASEIFSRAGMTVSTSAFVYPGREGARYGVMLMPTGVSKSSVLDHLCGGPLRDAAGVVTAGDGMNDVEMLSAATFGTARNVPVVIESDPRLLAAVGAARPDMIVVPLHRLPEGIAKAWFRLTGESGALRSEVEGSDPE